MTKVKMHFHRWNYCGGNEYWLNFKQYNNISRKEHSCSIKKQPSSTKGVPETWSSEGELRYLNSECFSTGAVGAQTRRSFGHHLLQLRLLVLCVPAVLRPRALQDAPALTDSNF